MSCSAASTDAESYNRGMAIATVWVLILKLSVSA